MAKSLNNSVDLLIILSIFNKQDILIDYTEMNLGELLY